MNILIISPVFPYPLDEGAKERIFQIIKGLSQQHKIHLITFYRNQKELQYLPELNKYCTRVDTIHNPRWSMLKTIMFNLLYFFSPTPTLVAMHQSREMRSLIESALARNHYDIVQIELTQMASYLKSETRNPKSEIRNRTAFVLVEHDVTFISRYKRLAHAPNLLVKLHWLIQYLKLRRFEINYCKKFDLIITVSEQSKQELQKYCPASRISVIRTGVELDTPPHPLFLEGRHTLSPLSRGDKGVCCRKVLFLGSLSHWPNRDAVVYFYQSIFPLIKEHFVCHSERSEESLKETLHCVQGDTWREVKKDVEFIIVGKDYEILPTAIKENKSVNLLGFVDDIKPLLEDAISIVPVRYGSGIRTKILTYMSYGSPVVSTPLGAEGLEVTHEENIIIADEPQEFAMAVTNLMEDEELRRRIAFGGYNLVKKKYQWDKSICDLQNEYIGMLKRKAL